MFGRKARNSGLLSNLLVCSLCWQLSTLVRGRTAVESDGFPADQHEPVELWGDEGGIGHIAVQGDVERHHVDGEARLPGVGPVHEREEEDSAEEERHQDENPVHLVQ